MEPESIGRYRLLGELGRGASGVVHRALDPDGGQLVAIKCLRAGIQEGDPAWLRFQRELAALRALHHPGVVQVLDAGLERGRPYVVMELVDGGSLEQRLSASGPLPVPEAVSLVATLARATAHAHAHGLIHRDIKPANVLLSPGGPKLTDFSLVKRPGQEEVRLTRTGDFLGTPGYMAPEQASASPDTIGPAADVYGLGALLYAALTGVAPHEGTTAVDVLVSDQGRPPPPPSQIRPQVQPALDAVCLRCLAWQPAARYAGPLELARALESLEGAPGGRPRRGPPLLAATALGCAALAALFAPRLLRGAPATPPPPAPAPPPPAPAAPLPPTPAGWDRWAPQAGLLDAAGLRELGDEERMQYLVTRWEAIRAAAGADDRAREAEVARRCAGQTLRTLHTADLTRPEEQLTPGLRGTAVELSFRPEHATTAMLARGRSALGLELELEAVPPLAVLRIEARGSTVQGIQCSPLDLEVSGAVLAREWLPGLAREGELPRAHFEVAGLLRPGRNQILVRLSESALMQCFLFRVELLVPAR